MGWSNKSELKWDNCIYKKNKTEKLNQIIKQQNLFKFLNYKNLLNFF